jgi:serine/threonine protein kinase
MTNGAGPAGTGAQPPNLPPAPDLPRRPNPPLPPGTTPLEPSDPKEIGEYRILAMLGIGGMGCVYLGQDPEDRRVAVKVVHPHLASDPEFLHRFAAEVHAARKVPAFCTAPVRDSGTHNGRPYLITDYLEGIALSRLIADDGPLDPATLHGLAVGAAAALTAIHGAGVVHRDLKPSNLVVTLGGVRIIDFGIARSLDIVHSHTRTGVILGSLGWASPEQLNAAPATPAMDVFGWACLVSYAATGKHPFGGEEAATRAWRILHADPDLDGLPDSLRHLVRAALSREPSRRPSARELLLTLTQANTVGDMSSEEHRTGAMPVAVAPPAGVTTTPVPAAASASNGDARAHARRRVAVTAATVPLALAVVFAAVKATSDDPGSFTPGDRSGETSIISTLTPGARKPGADTNVQPGDTTPSNGVRPNRTPIGPGNPPMTTPPGATPTPDPTTMSPTPEPTTPSPTPEPTTPEPTALPTEDTPEQAPDPSAAQGPTP